MNHLNISLVNQLPEEARKKMEQGLKEYEVSHEIDVDYTPFSLILSNEKNETIGVLEAFSSYSSIYINDMWVDKMICGLIKSTVAKVMGKNCLLSLSGDSRAKDCITLICLPVLFKRQNSINNVVMLWNSLGRTLKIPN
jgi:hypothetical protein